MQAQNARAQYIIANCQLILFLGGNTHVIMAWAPVSCRGYKVLGHTFSIL